MYPMEAEMKKLVWIAGILLLPSVAVAQNRQPDPTPPSNSAPITVLNNQDVKLGGTQASPLPVCSATVRDRCVQPTTRIRRPNITSNTSATPR